MPNRKIYATSLALVVLGTLGFGFALADAPPTKGRIPEQAFEKTRVNLKLVPDHIVAYARDGEVAGYIRRAELFDDDGVRRPGRLLVLDETLSRPVGHMVPGRGFVPIGMPDEAVPAFAPVE